MNRLAISTVIYQNYDVLHDFVGSLERQTNVAYNLYIVDLSQDKKKINYPHCKVIEGKNLGYAHGVNLGVKEAMQEQCDRFIIVNSDVVIDKNFVENTERSLNLNPSSIIGGKIYYAKGFEYHKDRYQKKDYGNVLWYAGGTVDWKNAYIQHRGVDEVDCGQYNQFEETEFVTGCFMAFDKNTFENVGMWNEEYFLYYEDADFCERAKRNGIKLYYDPSIVLWHKNAQSTDGSGSMLHQTFQRKSHLWFGLKYAPMRTKFHLIKNYYLGW